MFSAELREKAQSLVDRYPVGRSALLPLLHLVQSEDGYVSDDGISECASLLGLTKAEVNAVATFYSMYKRAPMGRHLVSVCTNFACKVRGAQEVYDRLSQHLEVGHNETTADGALTLEHAECLGNCEGAPVVTVDYLNYEGMTADDAVDLVEQLRSGTVPPPSRGFPSPGIRDISHRLAGLGPRNPFASGVEPAHVSGETEAPPVPESGPGFEREAVVAGFAGGEGGGAEERGPEGLEPESGSGEHDYGSDSEEKDEPTDASADVEGEAVREGHDA